MQLSFLHRSKMMLCFFILLLMAAKANAQYCTPAPSLGCFTGDYPVQFALVGTTSSINDPSLSCSGGGSSSLFGGYQDRTAETCAVASPSVVSGTITGNVASSSSSSSTTTTENMQLFVDWNNDGTFATSESVGGLALVNTFVTSFSITVPSGVAVGDYRMRLVYTATSNAAYPSISPCMATSLGGVGSFPYNSGEAIDYTLHVGTTVSCGAPTGLAASGVTNNSAVLNWSEPTGSVGSEYVVTTTAGTPTGSGATTTALTYSATGLTPSTVYYAYVRDSCGPGSFSSWVTTTFTTTATVTPTCNPVTGLTASAVTNTSATISWTAVSGSAGYVYAVDNNPAPPASGTFTTGTSAAITGLTPGTDYYAHVRDSCGPGSESGWVTILFTTTSSCAPVTGLTMSSITTTSAIVSWTAVTGSVGYVYVVDNSVTSPSGGGTFTSVTAVSVTGLTPGTTYYAHVRDSCAVGSESVWVTTFFTTLTVGGCDAVTSLAATGITASSATINWTMATGAIGAEYVVDTNPGDPAGAGTGTTGSAAGVTGLTAATLYYAHVRDSCSATSLSAWVTIPFYTLAPAGVNNVSNTDFSITAFPNPVKDEVTLVINGITASAGNVQLMDISGKLIKADVTNAHKLSMSMNGLPAGIYLVRYTDAGHTQTIKINKQ